MISTSARSRSQSRRFFPKKPLDPVMSTRIESIFRNSTFTTGNFLHKVQFQQQGFHTFHILPLGVV
jgi:hypothetical protein